MQRHIEEYMSAKIRKHMRSNNEAYRLSESLDKSCKRQARKHTKDKYEKLKTT